MRHFDPRHVLITGASSGIGAALARAYAGDGVTLVLTGRHAGRLEAVARECRQLGAAVRAETLDVRDSAGMDALIRAADREAPLDLVVANAGITGGTAPGRPFETRDAAAAVLGINLDGALNTILPAAEVMAARGAGRIAVVSSLAGLRGLPYSPAYSAAKAALNAYAEAIRGPLRRRRVTLSLILPGFVETPLDDSIESRKTFRVSAPRAARIIQRGLARGRARIAFPWPLYLGIRILARLPARWGDYLLRRFHVAVPPPAAHGPDESETP